jgi:8-amino-7-oxononanoate synthase
VNLFDEIDQRKKDGLFRVRKTLDSAQGPLVTIDDNEFLNFSSNDYLGLANNEILKSAMIDAINEYGLGAGSSQLVVGHSKPHQKLEQKLASFLKRDAALVFPSGYQANLAVASALVDKNTVVVQDKLNHASLIDAARLSEGKFVRYRHKDLKHLELLLEKHKKHNLIIMTDGVFSMDGDYAPLVEIADLCKTYNATLIVDDAHGLGVLGESGAGLPEESGLNQDQLPLLIGTFGKSFGVSGAFVSGSALHIEAFIQKARAYIYTTAILPSIASTIDRAIDLVIDGDHLRQHIKTLVKSYKKKSNELGLKINESESHIQPFVIGGCNETVALSNELYKDKILATAIRPPTVPNGTSRLRLSITAAHNEEQVERLVCSIKKHLGEN